MANDYKTQVELATKILDQLHEVAISKDRISSLLGIDIRSTSQYIKDADIWFRYRNGHYYRLGDVLPIILAAQKGKAGHALERKNDALARKTEIEIEQLERRLVNSQEVLEIQNEILGGFVGIVRGSALDDAAKEDIFTAYQDHLKRWEDEW